MSAPSDPHPPTEPATEWSPSTAEIPVVATSGATAAGRSLPPHPDAAPPAPAAAPAPAPAPAAGPVAAPQPTGPVDFVPGLPGIGTPPVPPPATSTPPPPVPSPVPPVPTPQEAGASGPSWPQTLESEATAPGRSRHLRGARGALGRTALLALGLAALGLVLVLLGLSLRFGEETLWSTIPLWSAFATLCAALGVLGFAPIHPGGRTGTDSAWRMAAAGLLGLAVFWLLVVLPNADTDRGFLFTAALGALGAALWTGPRGRS